MNRVLTFILVCFSLALAAMAFKQHRGPRQLWAWLEPRAAEAQQRAGSDAAPRNWYENRFQNRFPSYYLDSDAQGSNVGSVDVSDAAPRPAPLPPQQYGGRPQPGPLPGTVSPQPPHSGYHRPATAGAQRGRGALPPSQPGSRYPDTQSPGFIQISDDDAPVQPPSQTAAPRPNGPPPGWPPSSAPQPQHSSQPVPRAEPRPPIQQARVPDRMQPPVGPRTPDFKPQPQPERLPPVSPPQAEPRRPVARQASLQRPPQFAPQAQPRQSLPPSPPESKTSPGRGPGPGGPTVISGTGVLARVGSDVILEAEILPLVERRLAQLKEKMKLPDSQVDQARKMLIQQTLAQAIKRKLVFLDAKSDIPEENWEHVEGQLNEQFEKRLVEMVEKTQANSRAELLDRMNEQGMTLKRQKQIFLETVLAQQWIGSKSKIRELVTRKELWDYYQQHLDDYKIEASVEWEEIMLEFDEYPSKREAYAALARLGNRIFYGEDFAKVAQEHSHGFTAADGGRHEATTQGSLRCKAIDEALFTLDEGALSPILESEDGFHIVRVVKRTEAGHTPFRDAQPEIREKILTDRRREAREKYLAELKAKMPVWIADDYRSDELAQLFDDFDAP